MTIEFEFHLHILYTLILLLFILLLSICIYCWPIVITLVAARSYLVTDPNY